MSEWTGMRVNQSQLGEGYVRWADEVAYGWVLILRHRGSRRSLWIDKFGGLNRQPDFGVFFGETLNLFQGEKPQRCLRSVRVYWRQGYQRQKVLLAAGDCVRDDTVISV